MGRSAVQVRQRACQQLAASLPCPTRRLRGLFCAASSLCLLSCLFLSRMRSLCSRALSFLLARSLSLDHCPLSLSRPHRLLMVRWLNLRSFHGEKPPTQRLAELREALGEVALLIGALQMFAAEVHTAARSRTPATSPDNFLNSHLRLGIRENWPCNHCTALGCTVAGSGDPAAAAEQHGVQAMARAVQGLAVTLGVSAAPATGVATLNH